MQPFARMDDQGVKGGIKPILLNRREKGFQIDFLVFDPVLLDFPRNKF